MRRLGALCVCLLLVVTCGDAAAVVEIELAAESSTVDGTQRRNDSPIFVFRGASDAESSNMSSAIRRFEDSGLELPSLDIYFEDGCRERFGALGRFQMHQATPPWRIEACSRAAYLHELAHAWDRWNLTDGDRRKVMDLLGYNSWSGSDIPWAERGEEALAHLLARVLRQVVNNHPRPEQFIDYDHFETITGVAAPIIQVTASGTSPPY